jgi:hypothetical protein
MSFNNAPDTTTTPTTPEGGGSRLVAAERLAAAAIAMGTVMPGHIPLVEKRVDSNGELRDAIPSTPLISDKPERAIAAAEARVLGVTSETDYGSTRADDYREMAASAINVGRAGAMEDPAAAAKHTERSKAFAAAEQAIRANDSDGFRQARSRLKDLGVEL